MAATTAAVAVASTRARTPRHPSSAVAVRVRSGLGHAGRFGNDLGDKRAEKRNRASTNVTAAADATRTIVSQTVVSPSPKDPSCPSDWWKDAIVYQVSCRRG